MAKDYWADLPEKCKHSKKDRFNYLMDQIKGDSTSTTPASSNDGKD